MALLFLVVVVIADSKEGDAVVRDDTSMAKIVVMEVGGVVDVVDSLPFLRVRDDGIGTDVDRANAGFVVGVCSTLLFGLFVNESAPSMKHVDNVKMMSARFMLRPGELIFTRDNDDGCLLIDVGRRPEIVA
mmetsp:Transcript_38532/g.80754  ORF Transcript_38532/g.80754 Transcript_38532/m.80754 type:complete len:131 (+) Transcript_38532:623-1015(+)